MKIGIGLVLGILLAGVVLTKVGCNTGGETVSGPDPATVSGPPAAAAPAPAPTATPGLVGADPIKAYELTCFGNSTLTVKYSGQASLAHVQTSWTNFDDKTPYGIENHYVSPGSEPITRKFDPCVQGDADAVGVKEIGGCFWDINGKPFNPTPGAPQIAECRNRCDPKSEKSWIEDPEYKDGEWSSCSPNNQPPNYVATETQQCFKKATRTWTSVNKCTKEQRYRTEWIYNECECPCVETWTAQDPVVTYGEWSVCEINPAPTISAVGEATITQQCAGTKKRTVRTVINELNSCTRALRVKSDTTKEETAACQTACPICHTENDKWCWTSGQFSGQCSNLWLPGKVEKWQCQNVPPGTPGHTNHFNSNGHEDFWGWCGPVGGTSDKCYEIRN